MSETFYWVRAYETVDYGDGRPRWIGWNTIYQGFSYDDAIKAAQFDMSTNRWVIMDSQIVGNSYWEPRIVLNHPSQDFGDVLPPTPTTAPSTRSSGSGAAAAFLFAAAAAAGVVLIVR